MFAAFARFAVRFRWFILVAWLIATPVLASALPSLSSVTEFGTTAFLSPSAPSVQAGTMAGASRALTRPRSPYSSQRARPAG